MKYINVVFTKLIIVLLVTALTLFLFSCGGGESQESSGDQSSSASDTVSDAEAFSLDKAVALIERDRLITEIFVCNSLCGNSLTEAASVPVNGESEYADFSKIEELLNSTYLPEGGEKEFFLSYPDAGLPSVSDINGKTYVFNHIGSGYTDFIDASTVSVSSESDGIITAKTLSGKEVSLKAVKYGGEWLLEKGVFSINTAESEAFEENMSLSGLGSLGEFKGEILVIELYLSDDESDFTPEEEEAYHQKIKTAVDFLADSAENYGADVNVTYKPTYFEHDGVLVNKPLAFDVAVAATTFMTLKSFAEETCDALNYDNYFFVVCYNKEIKGEYNAFDNQAASEVYRAERAFFGNTSEPSELCMSILSMLGAYNYSEGKADAYTESLFKTYFPKDIMLTCNIENSEISPVTAYACGMLAELDPLYRVFIY